MNKTAIEWTTFSANPLKFRDATGNVVWGCVHASPGCVHCYAETLAKRYGRGGPFNVQTMAGLTPFLDEAELHKMLTYKPASGKRCFVGDMTDIFGPWVPDELLDRLFAVFALRPDVTWQLLTKRAATMEAYVSQAGDCDDITVQMCDLMGQPFDFFNTKRPDWPLPNVWLGVSCEDQQRADERVPHLLKTPASVRFISAEPLLGPINLTSWIGGSDTAEDDLSTEGAHCVRCGCVWEEDSNDHECPAGFGPRIDWVIPGGESGAGARPPHPAWLYSLRDQCVAAGVPFFFKQWGAFGHGYERDGVPVHRKFDSFQQWVNKAQTWVNGGVCVDTKGRVLDRGADFARARDEDAFPVAIVHRHGLKGGGRLLEGREWNEFPGSAVSK